MARTTALTIPAHLKTPKILRTVAEALAVIEHGYEAEVSQFGAETRLLSDLRRTCRHISDMRKLPLDFIFLDDLVEIDENLIAYVKKLGISHKSAVQCASCVHKLLDLAHDHFSWTCRRYELRKAWRPVRAALKGCAKGYTGIIESAIEHNCPPINFSEELMGSWRQHMFGSGRSLSTVENVERNFRAGLRMAQMQQLFPSFSFDSRKPTTYRLKLQDLPEPLRSEILELIWWKTADEDLDDRDAELIIRPVTGNNLLYYFLELCGYAMNVLEVHGIVSLSKLLTKEIVCGHIDWLQENSRCKPQSIIAKLSSIHYLTCTYPKLKGGDYSWFRAKMDTLRKEKIGRVQARKFDGLPDYPSIAEIVPRLLAFREPPNRLTEVETGWLIHDALIYMTNLLAPHRSRNTCGASIHPRERLNIFETEITSELLTQLKKLPAWAQKLWDKDPNAEFLVCHWVELETKAGQEVWELFPLEAVSLFKEYVEHYRPLLLHNYDPISTNLFFNRSRKKFTPRTLLSLVARIGKRFTGKRMTVKHFRDVVAAQMLSSGATVEEVLHSLAERLGLPKLTFQVIRRTVATLAQILVRLRTFRDFSGICARPPRPTSTCR